MPALACVSFFPLLFAEMLLILECRRGGLLGGVGFYGGFYA